MSSHEAEIESTLLEDSDTRSSEGDRKRPSTDKASKPNKRQRRQPAVFKEIKSHTREARPDEAICDDHKHKYYYCRYCNRQVSTNPSRFEDHLLKKHHIRIKTARPATKQAHNATINDIINNFITKKTNTGLTETDRTLRDAIQIPQFKEAVARLIAVHSLPYTLVEIPEFWACILAVNRMATEIIKVTRQDVPNLLTSTYLIHKDALKAKLQASETWIHFSHDMWTSPNHKSFMAINAHFVDSEQRDIACALLALREFTGTHSGEAMASEFLRVIDEYGIRGKVGFITMDNASPNDTFMTHISRHLKDFDPVLQRVRCFGHIVNLAVQAFLFGPRRTTGEDAEEELLAIKEAIRTVNTLSKRERSELLQQSERVKLAEEWRKHGVLGKLHNLVVFSRASTERYQEFKAQVGRVIPLDNDTRWNSWDNEVEVALAVRGPFRDWMDKNYELIKKDYLSHVDWQVSIASLLRINDYLTH